VPAQGFLGKKAVSVDVHLEHAAGGFDELDLCLRKCLADLGRQTGGPWLVVSDDAEFDGYAHTVSVRIAALDTPRHTAELARIPTPHWMPRPA
jgi:hypothetical protein